MHSIFVVSSITIYREGIVDFLDQQPDLRVVGSSERLEQRIGEFDLCVLDLAGHDDDAIAAFFHDMCLAGTPVVVVALPRDEHQVLSCLKSGASGYVTRDQSLDELRRVIELTLLNGACVQQCDIEAVVRHVRADHTADSAARDLLVADHLTARERQVAQLLSQSRSNREIARDLGISVHTAKHHVRNTLAKLGVDRRGEVVALRDRVGTFATE